MTCSSSGGRVAYLAPEITKADILRPTTSSDVYGLSMTFYNILSGQQPFADTPNIFATILVAQNGERPRRAPFRWFTMHQNARVWDLLQRMWVNNADERPTAQQVLDELWNIRRQPLFAD